MKGWREQRRVDFLYIFPNMWNRYTYVAKSLSFKCPVVKKQKVLLCCIENVMQKKIDQRKMFVCALFLHSQMVCDVFIYCAIKHILMEISLCMLSVTIEC